MPRYFVRENRHYPYMHSTSESTVEKWVGCEKANRYGSETSKDRREALPRCLGLVGRAADVVHDGKVRNVP
jgi:hypothetical protein